MKKITITVLQLLLFCQFADSQGTWTQKANIGGGGRYDPIAFAIGDKGYMGTGGGYPLWHKDFWEYDPTNDAWTQKADFGGGKRTWTANFVIGNKGYAGLGIDTNNNPVFHKDFWEYDPPTNNWTQIASFPGITGIAGAAFAVNGNGYILTGLDSIGFYLNHIWEYDPSLNYWQQKADFNFPARQEPISFVIGQTAYFGIGCKGNGLKDFWEYNAGADTWTQKASFPVRLFGSASFTIGNYGYVATGVEGTNMGQTNKAWRYDASLNTWTQIPNFGSLPRENARGFAINGKGYVGGGYGSYVLNDFWEFTPDSLLSSTTEMQNQSHISIHPNPFNSFTTIEFNISLQDAELTIYNEIIGKVKTIKNISGRSYKLSSDNLISGTYSIIIKERGKIISTGKIIIAKAY